MAVLPYPHYSSASGASSKRLFIKSNGWTSHKAVVAPVAPHTMADCILFGVSIFLTDAYTGSQRHKNTQVTI